MIYLIYGTDYFLIEQETKKLINDIDPINITNYDLDTTPLEDIIDDAQMLSMFSENKVIIVKNSKIFTSKKNDIPHNVELLEKYLSNPNPATKILFIADCEKLDARKKICKTIKKVGEVIQCETPANLNSYVLKLFDDYKIEPALINLFIERVGNNLSIINHEITKLKHYKLDDLIITKQDIIDVTSKNIQPDLFLFMEKLINKDIGQSLQLYHELLIFNEEPIKIITMLANQFRLIHQSTQLMNKGYSQKNIAELLGVHPYRVKLAIEKGYSYHPAQIITYIEKLADLDYDIKSGRMDKEIGLELFILSL